MHLDTERVHIPSHIVNESKILMDALASACDASVTRGFTLAAPTEWLRAWVACYIQEEERLRSADNSDLVNCLIVCFCS
jgi:hypothetical protein